MANSYLLYTGNGSTTQYSLSGIDGWISTGFLKVYFNSNANPEATNTYTFVDLTTSPKIQFNSAPANNTVIRIQRETPATVSTFRSNVVDFEDTSILTAADLDKSVQGLIHVVQEANDTGSGALPPTADGAHWNAESKRITNTAVPTDLNDVATKAYVDGMTLYGTTAVTVPQAWTFSGDSTTTDFTFSPAAATTDPAMFIVEVGGTIQRPTTDYTVTSSTLSFVSAPGAGTNNIRVRNLGVTRAVQSFPNNVTFGQNTTVTGNSSVSGNLAVTGTSAMAGRISASNGITANSTASAEAVRAESSTSMSPISAFTTSAAPIAIAAATSDSAFYVVPKVTGNGFGNPLVQSNDSLLFYQQNGIDTGSLVIGPWSTSAKGIRIDANGNLGVKKALPTEALDVSGNAAVSGNASVGGTLNVTGATTLGASTLSSLGVTNNATVGGTLGVTGAFTASGGLGGSLIQSDYKVALGSGTSIDCTVIPPWVKRISIAFANISTTGANLLILRMGTGSFATSGYTSRGLRHGVAWGNLSNGIVLGGDANSMIAAAAIHNGHFILYRMNAAGTIWSGSGQSLRADADSACNFSGAFVGSAMIDRIRITTLNGVETFDNGEVAFHWE